MLSTAPKNSQITSPYMTLKDAAKYIGISTQTLLKIRRNPKNKIKTYAICENGKRLFVKRSDIDDYIERNWIRPRQEHRATQRARRIQAGQKATVDRDPNKS